MPPDVTFALLERFEDERLLFQTHAVQGANPAVPRGALEIGERPDVELSVERPDGLRTDALELQEVEHGRRELRGELAMVRRVAGVGDLMNSRREIFADARNLTKPRLVQGRELMGMVGSDIGAVSICADLERVVALDLEEIGDLPKDP